jgi:hypothetical protein
MKKSSVFAIISMAVAISVMAVSCKKEAEADNSGSQMGTQAISSTQVKVSSLPVYYNGEKITDFEESLPCFSKDGDAEPIHIITDTALFYFDQDTAFGQFCNIQQMQWVYETNHKLDLIYQRAMSMGLTDDDTIVPHSLESYWDSIMGVPLNDTSDLRSLLYLWAFDEPFLFGQNRVFFAQSRPNLGNFNRRIESYRLVGLSGALVFCQQTWWGKPRTWHWTIFPGTQDMIELPDYLKNKYCSYFSVG